MVIHTLYGLMIGAFVLPKVTAKQRDLIISKWAASLLAVMNVRVIKKGHLPNRDITSTMFVANHISWLDIHALNSVRAVRFVSKSEVRNWPVFGRLAVNANTLFIDRAKKQDAGRIVEITTESLSAGDCLCYFPEGTTTDGTELKPFKGSLMQSAINNERPIWPFVIRYPNPDGSPNIEMAYAGETSLLYSMWQIVSLKNPVVELEFLAPISPKGHDRRSLTILVRQKVAEKLNLLDAVSSVDDMEFSKESAQINA
jgi:1-acyl-sn-glycerol-3-phosphate acyltransferase